MKFKSGFTLIELMIVLVVISIGVGLVYEKLSSKFREADIELLAGNVEKVKSAIQVHIRSACNSGSFSTPTINSLIAQDLLSTANQAVNPITDSPLTISISWGNPTTFEISANMGNAQTAARLMRATGATSVTGTNLVWRSASNRSGFDFESQTSFRRLFEVDCN